MSDAADLRSHDVTPPVYPVMTTLREVVETIQHDDVVRVERLSCGHTKATMTASRRPARRRPRCLKCEADDAN